MLPGGLLVLGVFIITALEMGNEFQNTLRRVSLKYQKFLKLHLNCLYVFTVSLGTFRLILYDGIMLKQPFPPNCLIS